MLFVLRIENVWKMNTWIKWTENFPAYSDLFYNCIRKKGIREAEVAFHSHDTNLGVTPKTGAPQRLCQALGLGP